MDSVEIPECRNPKLNAYIAVSVAVLAALMGIGKIKDDNICQAMAQAKADAVDSWNQYQAEKLKGRFEELKVFQIGLLSAQRPELVEPLKSKVDALQGTIEKYTVEAEALRTRAQEKEQLYDSLNFRDDQFDLADASLSLSLALFAVTALIGSTALFLISWLFGGAGALMCTAGLLGLSIHPDWIIKLLS